MEGKEIKKVYFIYAQKGEKNNIKEIETNDKVKIVKEISKENLGNSIQNIYYLQILKNPEENKININLIDNQGEMYISNIVFEPNEFIEEEEEENIDIEEKIIFKLKFKPFNNIEEKLDQIILPYNEQFEIFENKFQDNDKLMFSLYLNTISQVFLHPNEKIDFIFNFFLNVYEKINSDKKQEFKTILKYFFKNMKNILRNSDYVESLEIDEERLEIFNDPEKIRTKLLFLINEQKFEENIDIFLSYYYVHYNKKLFIKFINNEKYKKKLNAELVANRNLFNNFTTEIITPELMEEAQNGGELLSLMMLYPNIVECFKILTHYEIYLKFINFKQYERKCINIMLIQNPKKTDNIDLLNEYFKSTYDFFIEEQIYPLIIKEDFFVQYFKLFEQNDEDFPKLILIIEMLKLFNSKSRQKIATDNLLESYLDKGFSLLQKKKLKNLNFIKFLKSSHDKLKNSEYSKYFVNGIEFEEKNPEFIDKILNQDYYNLRHYLGNLYYSIFEEIFEKFILPKDLLVLRGWEITEETPQDMVEIFLKTITRIWINHPENHMYGLEQLFSKEFSVASFKVNNYQYYLKSIEEKIPKEKIMPIYSNILLKEFSINSQFENHIKEYIKSYDKITPKYLWYLMTTFPDHFGKVNSLGNYLESSGDFFSVKYSDFIHYPNITEETIALFANLKNHNIIPNYFEDSIYYKNSMRAKNYLEKNLFKDAVIMYSNLPKIQELIEQFFIEKTVEDFNNSLMLIISFQDKVDLSKKYYESLKKIQSYWSTFFPKDKSGDLIQLKNTIKDFENRKLEDCINETELNNGVIDFLPEAEEGIKLQGSIIFMELYDSLKQIKNEATRYDKCFRKFNELKNLGNNWNLNTIDKELKEVVINAVYKNINLLNEELNFIKDYFHFDKNSGNNFDIKSFRNNIIKEVKILQKNKGDYKINLDEKFKLDEEENKEQELEKENEINITDKGDNDFSLFDLDVNQKKSLDQNKKDIEDEKNKLKKEINNLSESYFYNSKIFLTTNNKESIDNFYESFFKFYTKLFLTGIGMAKLSLREIYNEIIPLSNKIFCIAKNIGIMDNNEKKNYEDHFLLISEFNLFIQTIEFYKKIEKINYMNVFSSFNKLYNNDIEINKLDKDNINKLLDILRDNIPKINLNNIFVEIFLYEYKKHKNKEMIKFILDKNFNFIYGDLIPIIDLIFSKEITDKLEFNKKIDENDLQFNSGEFQEINKMCGQDENVFSEMLMFYFENKIMRVFSKFRMEEDFFGNDIKRKYF